jgi:hypothetical protein
MMGVAIGVSTQLPELDVLWLPSNVPLSVQIDTLSLE